jgi:transcriptional regulator
MRDEKSDLLKGTLDMLILKIAALGPIHGYAIALRVQQISNDVFRLQQGSLYPTLHKLEKDKLLTSEWKPTDTGREAKFYSLTAKGRKRLELEVQKWQRVSGAVSMILSTAE